MNIQPIILAAGKGKRMGNPDQPKVLTPLNGRPIIAYLLYTLAQTDLMPPVLIVGFHQDQVKEALGDGCTYISQDEQLGTGHAVEICEPVLKDKADAFLVLCGDMPLWSAKTIERLVKKHEESGAAFSLGTVISDDEGFLSFGRIIRNAEGEIIAIREQKDCTPEESAIQEYNPSLFCFSNQWLWPALHKIDRNNSQGEYYLTELVEIAVQEKVKIASISLENWHEALNVNTPEQLAEVESFL